MRMYKIFAHTIYTHAAAFVSAIIIALLTSFVHVISVFIFRDISVTATAIPSSIFFAVVWYIVFVLLVRFLRKKVIFAFLPPEFIEILQTTKSGLKLVIWCNCLKSNIFHLQLLEHIHFNKSNNVLDQTYDKKVFFKMVQIPEN